MPQKRLSVCGVFFSRLVFHLTGFLAILFLVFGGMSVVSAQTVFPQEALADLIKPSIVRIVEHVEGIARIPEIKVDIRKHSVTVVPGKYNDVPVDEYLIGSGFIIHPDGYIVTNAHVVSEETVKQRLASESALAALYASALLLSDEEMQSFLETETDKSFSKEVLNYVMRQSIFQLQSNVAVLRHNSEKKTLPELLLEGFPATIVYENDNFLEDEKDVAFLKIRESSLPALSLGNSEGIVVGTKAFVFGFPATAQLRQNSSEEATFTGGLVSAIKQSANKNFKLFQTDAKVSEGSSGGPFFDEHGVVVGLVTFQTDELNRTSGDNFAFALPIEVVKAAALAAKISPTEGKYSEYFKKGFSDFSEKRCSKAEENFRLALGKSNKAFISEKYLALYFKQCDVLQKTGLALNTRFDEWRDSIHALGNPLFYFGVGSILLFSVFGGALFLILRQVRREEREIKALETRLYVDEVHIMEYDGVVQAKTDQSHAKSTSQKEKKVI
ncbi:MAG: serine protease [Candidatus Moranbacteria bacterium]|nr:serine protease [Candidatus Moranbacteria bacterium]